MDLTAYGLKSMLVGSDKGGANERQFYKALIATADRRFDRHLEELRLRAPAKKQRDRKHGEKS